MSELEGQMTLFDLDSEQPDETCDCCLCNPERSCRDCCPEDDEDE